MRIGARHDHRRGALIGLAFVLTIAGFVAVSPDAWAVDLTVNRTGDAADTDTNDNICDSNAETDGKQCTLRAAIEQANATPGADSIAFRIPGDGRHKISPTSELPAITETVTVDGYTEPGSSVNTAKKGTNAKLMVELSGEDAPGSDGLYFDGASGSVLRGLVIHSFDINVHVPAGSDNTFAGNFIGTNATGTKSRPLSTAGMLFAGGGNTVGGTTKASRNLIAGGENGIVAGSNDNVIRNNVIGPDKTGKKPLGNGVGVYVLFADNNQIRNNLIAFNVRGVFVTGFDALGNSILNNSIFANEELGIDLDPVGPNGNDADMFEGAQDDDQDFGPNGLQNYPHLDRPTTSAEGTEITGYIESGDQDETPDAFVLQFFLNPTDTGEGKTLLATETVVDDGTGMEEFEVSLSRTVPLGSSITATATKEDSGEPMDTSEFSIPRMVRRPADF